MSDYQSREPLTELCGLWQNVSKNGMLYFSGRIGDAKILIFPVRDHDPESKKPTHRLLMQHAPRHRREAPREDQQPHQRTQSDDDVPF